MKKIFMAAMAVVLAVGVGAAYAGGMGNGITDFTGKTNDRLEIAPAGDLVSGLHESSAAGSRRGMEERYNGVTDFKGTTNDRFEVKTAAPETYVESSAAGSRRGMEERYNGVTDFKGRSNDRFEIGG